MPFTVDYSPAGLYMRQASRAGRGDRFLAQEALAQQRQRMDQQERQIAMEQQASEIQQALAHRQQQMAEAKAFMLDPQMDQLKAKRELELTQLKEQYLSQRAQDANQLRQAIADKQIGAADARAQAAREGQYKIASLNNARALMLPALNANAKVDADQLSMKARQEALPDLVSRLRQVAGGDAELARNLEIAATQHASGMRPTPFVKRDEDLELMDKAERIRSRKYETIMDGVGRMSSLLKNMTDPASQMDDPVMLEQVKRNLKAMMDELEMMRKPVARIPMSAVTGVAPPSQGRYEYDPNKGPLRP